MQNITITENGVYKLLRNIKPHKATGPDNILARYLKELALELTPAITFLFQTSLEQGKLPNDWLQAHIVNVFKKGDHKHCIQLSTAVINIYTMQNTRAYSKFKHHETSRYP
jgi:hypothetical protein